VDAALGDLFDQRLQVPIAAAQAQCIRAFPPEKQNHQHKTFDFHSAMGLLNHRKPPPM